MKALQTTYEDKKWPSICQTSSKQIGFLKICSWNSLRDISEKYCIEFLSQAWILKSMSRNRRVYFSLLYNQLNTSENHKQMLELLSNRLNQEQSVIRSPLIYLFKPKNKWKLSYRAWIPMRCCDYHVKRLGSFSNFKFLLKFCIDNASPKHFLSPTTETPNLPFSTKKGNKIVHCFSKRTFKTKSSRLVFSARCSARWWHRKSQNERYAWEEISHQFSEWLFGLFVAFW